MNNLEVLHKHGIEDFSFVDVGAKDKLDSIFYIEQLTNLHAFEPILEEYSKLESLYKTNSFKSLTLNNYGLSDFEGTSSFRITNHPSMSSLLEPDTENYNKHFGAFKEYKKWEANINVQKEISIQLKTLDHYFETSSVILDYLKIDTQGSELQILKGAKNLIEQQRVLIIKVEVSTIPVYKNQALFSDIDIYLRQHQYTLVDFITYRDDYLPIISSLKQNAHYAPCGDAIYVLNDKCETLQKSIKKGLILNWLGYKGIAENIMTDAGVEKEDVKQLLKGKSVNASSFFNRFIKNMTPPVLLRLIKKIVWRLKRV
jgi:FkbM family methyltransferase